MNSDFLDQIKGLNDPEFGINDVRFRITKLSPLKGFKLFEKIRHALAVNADGVSSDSENGALVFYKSILTLSPDTIESFMVPMFGNVEFKGSGVEKGWAPLEGMEDMAFQSLEPIHIYELFVRCLAVNFTGSFRAIASKFPGVERILNQLKQ